MTTAAGKFAEKAEALGWTVTRTKRPGWRGVQAAHGQEQFTFEWTVNETTGNYVFLKGEHHVRAGSVIVEEWSNLSAALRVMADPGHVQVTEIGYHRLPFDPTTATNAEVLAAVEGREISWRNSITGATEAAIVPWQGRHTVIFDGLRPDPARRVLSFASYEAGAMPVVGSSNDTRAGFRSVRLSAIVTVGDRCYRPRAAA